MSVLAARAENADVDARDARDEAALQVDRARGDAKEAKENAKEAVELATGLLRGAEARAEQARVNDRAAAAKLASVEFLAHT